MRKDLAQAKSFLVIIFIIQILRAHINNNKEIHVSFFLT